MSLTRDEVYAYTTKLYKFLREGHSITFRRLHHSYMGEITYDERGTAYVKVDHRDKMFSTLLHEFLHYAHPKWSETKVLEMERKLVNALTPRQVKNIIKRLAEAL